MRTIVLQIHYKNIELTRECRLTLIDSKVFHYFFVDD